MTYVSRTLLGGCLWYTLPEVQATESQLRRSDPFLFGTFDGLKRDASARGGLQSALWVEGLDYRIPMMYPPDRVTKPPWIGEFKCRGKPRKTKPGLDWRLYFCEPAEVENLVVVCGFSHKDPNEADATEAQEDAVRQAMGLFQHYCRLQDFSYAPFE